MEGDRRCPEERANIFSKQLYTWVNPILNKGLREPITKSDIPRRPKVECTDFVTKCLEENWNREKQKKSPNLICAIHRANWRFLLYTALTLTAEFVCITTRPLFMNRLLLGFRDMSITVNRIEATVYGISLAITTLISICLRNSYFWMVYRMGMRARVSVSGLIYKKILSMNQKSLASTAAGQVINLLSSDVQRLEETYWFFHYSWLGPLQAIIIFYLMGEITLIPTLCGAFVMVFFIPMQSILNHAYSKLKVRILRVTDARIRMLSDIINGIKITKLHAWENLFTKFTHELRQRETKLRVYVRLCQVFQFTQLVYQVKIAILAMILAIVLLHDGPGDPAILRSSNLFTLMNYMNSLFLSLTLFLPICIQSLFDTQISCNRIQKFLLAPDLQGDKQPIVTDSSEPHISLDNVSASWFDLSWKPTLYRISLEINGPQLIAIVGPVGSGKSSLLQVILGEFPYFEGRVERTNSMAYMPQVAWITPGTVRDNVLLSEPFDHRRYSKVLEATTLDVDLRNLPHGDKTKVGERGSSLSGGQKARIGLARVAYSNASCVLLDDPLAAVDAHVGSHLFHKCICGLLKNRLRILVTNQLHFLRLVDKIILMEEGTVAQIGTYEELVARGIDFQKLECDKEAANRAEELEHHLKEPHFLEENGIIANGTKPDPPARRRSIVQRLRRLSSMKDPDALPKTEAADELIHSLLNVSVTSKPSGVDTSGLGLTSGDDSKRNENTRASLVNKVSFRRSSVTRESISSRLAFSMENAVAYGIVDHVTTDVGEGDMKGENELDKEEEEQDTEQYQEGSVSWRYYFELVRIGGGIVGALATVLLFVITITNYTGCDVWITKWSELVDYRYENNITVNASDTVQWSMDNNLFNMYVLVVLTVALVVFSTLRSITFFAILLKSSKILHNGMVRACLNTRLLFFESNTSGRILNRFSKDIGQLDDYLPPTVHDFLQCFFLVVSLILVTLVSSYWLLIPMVPLLILFYYIRKYYLCTSRVLKRMEAVARSPVFSWVNVTLQGLPCIRASRCEDYQLRKYMEFADEHTSVFYLSMATTRWLSFRLDLLCSLFITCTIAVCLLLGAFSSISGGDVGLMVTYALSLAGLFQWCVRQSAEVENQMVSVERCMEYAELEPEVTQPPILKPPDDWPTAGNIIFDGLWLRYKDGAPYALKDIQLTIPAGLKVGIVGRTGAGKSSLISAIFRLVESEQGRLVIDGIDVARLELSDLRKRISIIPQDPIMFQGTIRSNLDPELKVDYSVLWNALESVHLKSLVSRLPGELDFHITEGGANFSTGQRQLLALARAILGGNRILVVDEATANVDPYTDGLIQRTLRSQFATCTVMTVAHRLNTVIDNDLMVVMETGRIVETGIPHELLNPDVAKQDKADLEIDKVNERVSLDPSNPITGRGHLAQLVKQTGLEESATLAELARNAYAKTLNRMSPSGF